MNFVVGDTVVQRTVRKAVPLSSVDSAICDLLCDIYMLNKIIVLSNLKATLNSCACSILVNIN